VKIAVLGAGGFVGSRLIEYCQTLTEFEFIPILRSPKSLARLSKINPRRVMVNTSSVGQLSNSLRGFDAVINLSSGQWNQILMDVETIWESCQTAGVPRLIHTSSAVVFGQVENPEINDDSPPDLKSWMLYAREKGRAEVFLREKMGSGKTKIIVLRPGLIWGPRSPWTILPAKQLSAGNAWLCRSGKGICNLVHVDNVVRYVLKILRSDRMLDGFFNISDPEVITWLDYYTTIAQNLGYPVDRIQLTESRPRVLSLGSMMEVLKQNPSFYEWMKRLLNVLSSESKSNLKYYFPTLAGGGASVPLPVGLSRPTEKPKVSKELWALQNTRHPLSSRKFLQQFGDPNLLGYSECLSTSVAWLRFAGFSA
jgi:nucleoside-diphosphate-sugar epimerase